ncbi:MAG: hypothetical protein PHP22_10235 [Oscillospiraceae bacterium]|nr:hypothetical protein [Oscillospiraceae bacterium]
MSKKKDASAPDNKSVPSPKNQSNTSKQNKKIRVDDIEYEPFTFHGRPISPTIRSLSDFRSSW